MKNLLLCLLVVLASTSFAQKKETIRIPARVNYKYLSGKKYQKAYDFTLSELVKTPTYEIVNSKFFIGPYMWDQIDSIPVIKEMYAKDVTVRLDRKKLPAKYVENFKDAQLLWDWIREQFNGIPMRLRKATYEELDYYWTVIYFDIDEPLFIAETPTYKFILDLDRKNFQLEWLDMVPADIDEWLDSL